MTNQKLTPEWNEEAELKLTLEWHKATQNINKISTFRTAMLGNETAIKESFTRGATALEQQIRRGSKWDKIFKDKKGFFDITDAQGGFAQGIVKNQMNDVHNLLKATSLVMVHSVLDNYLFELIQIIKMVAIKDFKDRYRDRKVSLSDVALGEDALLSSIIDKDRIDRKSLLEKVDMLFQLCRPGKDFSPIEDYKFERSYLETLDEVRHEIVHQDIGLNSKEWNIDTFKIGQTIWFFVALLHSKYDLHICPTLMAEHFKGQKNSPPDTKQPKNNA